MYILGCPTHQSPGAKQLRGVPEGFPTSALGGTCSRAALVGMAASGTRL